MSEPPQDERVLGGYLTVPDPLPEHAAAGSRGLIVDINCDSQGVAHCGLANPNLQLGVELTYSAQSLPRLANWQHYGPRGSYVCALEPFSGSLWGKQQDKHPLAAQWLEPGQTKNYDLTITVHADAPGIEKLLAQQGDLRVDF